ncbi:MAG: universal stress protein [Dehalococcoidia bacterium]|nr:universal stress protein [Dehalococcoidia bacterium]MCA9843408.1 universal stress protein [Dehalococcoidia bacterium]MCA9852344.1 universal stress protein [Dehalococcoidia bacterium]
MPVLVAIDGSEASWAVLPHANRFAQALGLPLSVVRVLNPLLDVGDEFGPSISDAADSVAARWDSEITERLKSRDITANTRVEIVGRKESISDAIVRLGEEAGAEAIAMNSRGTGTIRHVFLGSTALAVLGKAGRPVLLTGPGIEPSLASDAYRVAITSDGSPAATAGVAAFAALFAGTSVEPILVGAYSRAIGDDEPMREMGRARAHLEELRAHFADDVPLQTRIFECEGNESTSHAIVRGANELEASLIAMSTHGHSALRRIVAGSTAMGVLKQSTLPVLLVPAE